MKMSFEGMKATRKGLRVYVVVDYGASVRFASVLIPIDQLDASACSEVIDQKVRNDLLSIWSAERGDAALF